MMNNTIRSISILLTILAVSPAPVFAWDNNDVHPQITEKAIELFLKTLEDGKRNTFKFKDDKERLAAFKSHAFYQSGEQCKFIDEGSVKEDIGLSPERELTFKGSWDIKKWGNESCDVDQFSLLSHAYNPMSRSTWPHKEVYDFLINDKVAYKHALHRAVKVWMNMTNFKNSPDAQENYLTYFTLGRLCHLIQDMTVPSHVHADFHGTGDDMEKYAEQHIAQIMNNLPSSLEIKKPTTHGLRKEYPHFDLREEDNISYFIENLAYQTYRMTSYYGGKLTKKIGDAQPDSELKRMFPYNTGKSLRWYPGPLRYDTGGFFAKDAYIIDNVGYLWSNGKNNDWWECPEDPGYYYLEKIDGWTIGGEAIPQVFKSKQHSFERIDATNLDSLEPNTLPLPKLYAERLFPLAVEWTAGLLQALYPQVTGPKDFEKKECKCWPFEIKVPDLPWVVDKRRRENCTCYFEEGDMKNCDCHSNDGTLIDCKDHDFYKIKNEYPLRGGSYVFSNCQ